MHDTVISFTVFYFVLFYLILIVLVEESHELINIV
jgi:hypothetical protein